MSAPPSPPPSPPVALDAYISSKADGTDEVAWALTPKPGRRPLVFASPAAVRAGRHLAEGQARGQGRPDRLAEFAPTGRVLDTLRPPGTKP